MLGESVATSSLVVSMSSRSASSGLRRSKSMSITRLPLSTSYIARFSAEVVLPSLLDGLVSMIVRLVSPRTSSWAWSVRNASLTAGIIHPTNAGSPVWTAPARG